MLEKKHIRKVKPQLTAKILTHVHLKVLWFNPSWQTSTMKHVGWDKNNLIIEIKKI